MNLLKVVHHIDRYSLPLFDSHTSLFRHYIIISDNEAFKMSLFTVPFVILVRDVNLLGITF